MLEQVVVLCFVQGLYEFVRETGRFHGRAE